MTFIPREGAWIGVDFDGTASQYTRWVDHTHCGAPISVMISRIRKWIAAGYEVRIFTARVASILPEHEREEARKAIEDWTEQHIGIRLRVTSEKDFGMIESWDDRAIGVRTNSGEIETGQSWVERRAVARCEKCREPITSEETAHHG